NTIEKNKIPVLINNLEDKYMLKEKDAWVDYKVFKKQRNQINEVTEKNHIREKHILDIYTRNIFGTENYEWTFNKREELRFLWMIYMEKLSDFYVEQGKIHEALMLNLKMCDKLPNNTLVKEDLNKLYVLIGEPGIE